MWRPFSVVCLCIIVMVSQIIYAQDINEDLILGSIGGYKASKNPSCGQGPGILAATGHFDLDHQDTTYRISYYDLSIRSGAKVQVTRHAGVDSDQWLLHEVESSFRSSKEARLGMVSENARIRELFDNRIFFYGGGIVTYNWISNNSTVLIEYSNFSGPKPEPLEVVRAYLEKYPSTLPEGFVFNAARDEQWIKDEMSRRLWLCDKWFAWQAGGNVEMSEALDEVMDHLEEFLDYRQRYFGMNANQEKMDLIAANRSNDEVAMKAKVAQYKQWWNSHKGDPIPLP